MSLSGVLLLPPSVVLEPVSELSEETRRAIGATGDDLVVGRANSRAGSRVVNAATGRLLSRFRSRITVADAVLDFARAEAASPEEVLEAAYPVLRTLHAARFLVGENDHDAAADQPCFEPGALLAGATVSRCVYQIDDSEVYQARRPDGRFVALKIARREAGAHVAERFAREARVLGRLRGLAAPALLSEGIAGGLPYLEIDWVAGSPVSAVAAELRRMPDHGARALALLGSAIAEAYADVHALGVVHGDVHPRNVLVDGAGAPHLVDFGMGRCLDDTDPPPRAGVPFYFEPEYARARLQGSSAPATPAGEQYAVAALVHELFTGHPCLDFSLESDGLFEQIATAEVVSFEARGVPPLPAIEAALARALAKHPAERFASMRDFAAALRRSAPVHKTSHSTRARLRGIESFANEHFDALLTGARAGRLPSAGPTCSAAFGAAGAAYACFRLACARGSGELLAAADVWSALAVRHMDEPGALDHAGLGIGPEIYGPASLLHARAGVHVTRALIAFAMGDDRIAAAHARAFVSEASTPHTSWDLTLGRTAALLGCASLIELAPASDVETRAVIETLAADTVSLVEGRLSSASDDAGWLGIAHGRAGLLYGVLRWCSASGETPPPFVREGLSGLAALGSPIGRGTGWPRSIARDERAGEVWPGWCHGSSGHAELWCLAHEVTGDASYLQLAEGAANHAWESAERGTGSLCCGSGGQAYALFQVARSTRDARWSERSFALVEDAVGRARRGEGLAGSLYKGDLGIALLAAEAVVSMETPSMPLFGREPR